MSPSDTDFEQQQHYLRLLRQFNGAQRAQLKPLAQSLGISSKCVRNRDNVLTINGIDVVPAKICGRLTYDLREVAVALSARAQQLDGAAA